uniref:Chaperonin 10 n=1 Tax=Acrobeloides nanus TaxID=290746 RepID=A0A914CQM4_9BILA
MHPIKSYGLQISTSKSVKNFKLIGDLVIFQRLSDRFTYGPGFILAKVVSVGMGKSKDNPMKVKVGDEILLRARSYDCIIFDNNKYEYVNEEKIFGVFTKEADTL